MAIDRIGSGPAPPPAPKDVSGEEGTADDKSPNTLSSGGGRSDSVELSKQGLARAAEFPEESGNDVTAERGVEIEMRIAAAFYDEPSVALEVARRLLDSGDLLADQSIITETS